MQYPVNWVYQRWKRYGKGYMKKRIKVKMQCICIATVYADVDASGNVSIDGVEEIEDVEDIEDFEILE